MRRLPVARQSHPKAERIGIRHQGHSEKSESSIVLVKGVTILEGRDGQVQRTFEEAARG